MDGLVYVLKNLAFIVLPILSSGIANKDALELPISYWLTLLPRFAIRLEIRNNCVKVTKVQRAIRMVREELPHLTDAQAEALLETHGSVRNAVEAGREA